MKDKEQTLAVSNGNGGAKPAAKPVKGGLETLKAFIDQATDGMVVIDFADIVLYANVPAESFLHRSRPELLGRPCPFPLSGEGRSVLKFSCNGDGEKRAFVRVTKIAWGQRAAYLVAIKGAENGPQVEALQTELVERRRLDALKDKLVATVSHEIRSPLTVIQAAVESLNRGLGGRLSPPQAQLVRMADRSTARLLRITENLLELSRLESGRMAVKARKIDAARLIREVTDGLRLVAGVSGAAIVEELPAEPATLTTDPNLLVELLHNLIENAQRYAKSKVLVRAEMRESEPAARRLELAVVDDGPGIAQDRIGTLFDKNVQLAHSHFEGAYRGSGLGLSICKEIVEALSGRIWVESVCGQGSVFRVALPCSGNGNGNGHGGHRG